MFPKHGFRWLTGIEDTCVYAPPRYGMPPLDEFALTGHDTHWRDDLRLAVDLGATGLRYGVGWPRVHTAPGVFDWRELDERVEFARTIGLELIADLVHYGAPTWLDGAFADPLFPRVMAEYAGAFAERYRGAVDVITPLNEPLTTASFSGLRGVWPPALSGWRGWTSVVVTMVAGIRDSIDVIRAANPDATVLHVEASTLYESDGPDLDDHVELLRMTASLPTELLLGRVDRSHPGWAWLTEHGADAAALRAFAGRPVPPDLLGINYYPDLTPRRVVAAADGPRQLAVDRGGDGLHAVLSDAGERWQLPLVITETSVEGDEQRRTDWLTEAASVVAGLRRDGADIRGLTWWPLLDFVDWSWAAGGRNVEEFAIPVDIERDRANSARLTPYLRRMGVVRLDEEDGGELRREPDASARRFAELTGVTARSLAG